MECPSLEMFKDWLNVALRALGDGGGLVKSWWFWRSFLAWKILWFWEVWDFKAVFSWVPVVDQYSGLGFSLLVSALHFHVIMQSKTFVSYALKNKKTPWPAGGFVQTWRKEGITPWCHQLNCSSESCLISGFARPAFFLERSYKCSVWTIVTSLQPARISPINETQLNIPVHLPQIYCGLSWNPARVYKRVYYYLDFLLLIGKAW